MPEYLLVPEHQNNSLDFTLPTLAAAAEHRERLDPHKKTRLAMYVDHECPTCHEYVLNTQEAIDRHICSRTTTDDDPYD